MAYWIKRITVNSGKSSSCSTAKNPAPISMYQDSRRFNAVAGGAWPVPFAASLGGQIKYITYSGAAMPPRIMRFFDLIGIPLIGSYGSTECGGVTLCGIGENRPGNLGKPFANVEIRIANDAEILVRGPTVTPGYFKNPEATREALDANGWFHTGDLGALDDDGSLTIIGRKKDVFNCADGWNIYPGFIELRLESETFIRQAVLLGDRRPFVAALIVPDRRKIAAALAQEELSLRDDDIKAALWTDIDRVNRRLEHYEQVRKIAVIEEDFPNEVRSVNIFAKTESRPLGGSGAICETDRCPLRFDTGRRNILSIIALITGGGNGIGRAVAHRMAAAGMTVIIADYDHTAAEQVRGEIAEGGGQADALSVDVTQARDVKAVVNDVAKRFGRIDVLANIAGGSFYTKRIEEFTWAEWKQVIDTNLKGTFLMCREAAPIMQGQKSGRILNTASNYAISGSALRAPYSAAKAGIVAFTKSLALELAADGIRVNTVAPGPTDTPRVMEKETPDARKQRWSPAIPLGRTGTPEDLAELYYFLTTAESRAITGQTFHCNGGLL